MITDKWENRKYFLGKIIMFLSKMGKRLLSLNRQTIQSIVFTLKHYI
jgi:hypothetical protein